MNKKWEVCEKNDEQINKIIEENNLSLLLASILSQKRNYNKARSTNLFKSYKK